MELDPHSDPIEAVKTTDKNDEKEKSGHLWSDASMVPYKDKGRSGENRGKNRNKSGGSEPIKGTLVVIGFPTLKAKGTVNIQGVGDTASGTWYVKSTHHSWSKGKGYITKAELVRGRSGKGDSGGRSPLVMYADIWADNKVYVGSRKDAASPQHTFTFGEGKDVVSFKYHCKPQMSKSAGEKDKGRGRGVNLWEKNKDYAVGPAEKKDGGK